MGGVAAGTCNQSSTSPAINRTTGRGSASTDTRPASDSVIGYPECFSVPSASLICHQGDPSPLALVLHHQTLEFGCVPGTRRHSSRLWLRRTWMPSQVLPFLLIINQEISAQGLETRIEMQIAITSFMAPWRAAQSSNPLFFSSGRGPAGIPELLEPYSLRCQYTTVLGMRAPCIRIPFNSIGLDIQLSTRPIHNSTCSAQNAQMLDTYPKFPMLCSSTRDALPNSSHPPPNNQNLVPTRTSASHSHP
ncbi:hypothetical protein P152DRAFT_459112 [Eremomyces bilateralis CBS 781.70]|uniref:Uncharacterized protein n=1 Tax=Eremomyces bilateralis CBS 781.70 TaxID=1392243 RepID=A0A6G1G0K9_9PEZI|nr:uncharacterized protein P152DRAFT_459112 [Eremomyces bilateralis CBS 781.70]KAF1811647.1 hypothetical protein P152DRAFT_459112 [Eremomyces bilateralis CBS 781.70]